VTSGDLVFLSGKIGEAGEFAHEAETSLDRVEAELEKLGLTFADVVEARIFLVDMERYGEFNEIYARRLSAPYPARACVAVAALPRGAQVEVQMVARTR
jgi:2-iminobutanoate/2-iminopropanoate deaminase